MSIWILLLLFLNFGISWFNAWSVGRSWADSKIIGGWTRFMVWCGAVMSACGFTWCYLIPLALGIGFFYPKYLPPEYVRATLELGYVVIIFPILGSGLAILIDSLTSFWRRKSFANAGIAGWNTFAMAHNTYHAARALPGIFKHLGGLFKGGSSNDARAKLLMFVVVLVILAACAGTLTTRAIVMKTARKYALSLQQPEGV